MTIRVRGYSFQVDVKVRGSHNPTGAPLRIRADFPSHGIATRMEAFIRRDLMCNGAWTRDPLDPEQATRRQPMATCPIPLPAATRKPRKIRAPETQDELFARRNRILRLMGEYPCLV